MLLSRGVIMGNFRPFRGAQLIVIDPFDMNRLSANTYDVGLGEWYYRTQEPQAGTTRIFNPYSEEGVKKLWGEAQQAQIAEVEFEQHDAAIPAGIHPKDRVILVQPLETLLCHTVEFIGGRGNICGWMQGKSGWSRSFIAVCMDAGLGDIGYVNRWTMEITNRHPDYAVPLIVGQPVAKIAFLSSNHPVQDGGGYSGSYQPSDDMEQIKRDWKPENMLPQLYRRRR